MLIFISQRLLDVSSHDLLWNMAYVRKAGCIDAVFELLIHPVVLSFPRLMFGLVR